MTQNGNKAIAEDKPKTNPQQSKQLSTGVNSTGMPLSIFQQQWQEKDVPDEQKKYTLDIVSTTMHSLQADPNFDIYDVMFNVDNINGPSELLGEQFPLKWKINPDNEYYKKQYPNLDDKTINSFREIYKYWEEAYDGGYLNDRGRYSINNAGLNSMQKFLVDNGIDISQSMTLSPGIVSPELSALGNYEYMTSDGDIKQGRPVYDITLGNGQKRRMYKATQIVPYPGKEGQYIFKEISDKGKEATPNITNIALGSSYVSFTTDYGLRDVIAKGGKPFTYMDNGKEVTATDLAYDKNGLLVTTNKYLGKQHQYNPGDEDIAKKYQKILKEQKGIDVSDIHNREEVETFLGANILKSKPQNQTYAYNETYGLVDTYLRALSNSIPNMITYGKNLIMPGALSDASYYESLMNDHKSAIAVDNSSPFYSRNIMKMLGDNTIQFLPSILLAPFTAGTSLMPSLTMIGGKALLKGGVKGIIKAGIKGGMILGKNGANVLVKKNITKTVLNDYVLKNVARASFFGVAGGQSGYGQYKEGIMSGVNDADAKAMSIVAAAITMATSRLLEPSYIKPGFYMGLNKTLVKGTLESMSKKAGIEMFSKAGKQQFGKSLFKGIANAIQLEGMGGYGLRVGVDALFEGTQEFTESVLIGLSQGIYNKGWSKPGTTIGEGKYDVSATFGNLGADFVLGAAMGLGFSLNPRSIIQGVANARIRKQNTEELTLYSQFQNVGVDKALREAQSLIAEAHSKNGFLGQDLDIEGNAFTVDEKGEKVGKTLDITGQPAAKLLGINELKTMNDMRAYNMLTEVSREAELFNEVKKNPVIENISAEALARIDIRNNIVINAASSYKKLEAKKEQKATLEKQLEEAKTDKEKETIKADINKLMSDDIHDDETLASAQYKYDMWTKPMSELETEELGQASTYNYSKGVKEAIINNMLTIQDAAILKIMKDKKLWEELNTSQKNSLQSQLSVFTNIGVYQSVFGEIDYAAYSPTDKKSKLFGLGKIIHDYNEGRIKDKYTPEKMASISSMMDRIATIANSSFDLKTRRGIYEQIDGLMQELRTEIGDSREFSQAMALYNTEETGSLISSINDSISKIMSMKNKTITATEEDIIDIGLDDFSYDESLQDTLNNTIESYLGKELGELIGKQEKVRRRKLTINDIEGDEDVDIVEVLDALAEKGIDLMTKDMPLEMLTSKGIPSQFKSYTIGDMLRYIEENKNASLDISTMDDISKVLEIIKEHYDKISFYLSTLETLQNQAEKNELYKVHTYINNITKRYLQNKSKIEEQQQNALESIQEMEVNLRKNGFTRDKDDVRYLAANVSNTQTYMETIGATQYIPTLKLFFKEKDKKITINPKAKGLEGLLAKRLEDYLNKKGIPKDKWEDVFKEMYENILYIEKTYSEYDIEIKKVLTEYFGTPPESSEPNSKEEYTINSILKELENTYNETGENSAKKIEELKGLLNTIYALQWQARNKLSGKLTLHLLMTDAIGDSIPKTYQFMEEHKGRKLYAEKQEDGISTVYKGTYAPADIALGTEHIFAEIAKMDNTQIEELKEIAKLNNIPLDDNMSDSDIIYTVNSALYPNYQINKDSAFHMLMTNLSVDNYLGGKNMSVSDIMNSIDSFKESRLINNKIFTDEERDIVKELIVYENNKIDVDKTIEALSKYIEENKSVNKALLAQTIFRDIRMNINIEQEQTLIHMVANYYKNINGDFGLGMSLNTKSGFALHDNSICVLGGGGSGKSTMIMENYYNIIRNITQKEVLNPEGKPVEANRKLRILILSPTHRITKQQTDIINNVFAADEVEVDSDIMHNFTAIDKEYDLVVIDEASLISKDMNNKELRPMLNKVNASQVVFLYDTNQTVNAEQSETNFTSTLGERAVPLEIRHRSGLIDVNTLSNFFMSDNFIQQYKKGDNQLAPMESGGYKIRFRYKTWEGKNGNGDIINIYEGVKVNNDEIDVINDYRDVKGYSNDVAIVVRTQEEKNRICKKYDINTNDVFILEYGDENFNVSGMSAGNVFVIMDSDNVLKNTDMEDSFKYEKLSKWYNTAITRVRGDGFLSIQYPNSTENRVKLEENDMILKYNDVLDYTNASKDDIIPIFDKQARVELNNSNNVLDRHNKIRDKVEAKYIKGKERKDEIGGIDKKREAPMVQHVVENIAQVAAPAIIKLQEETKTGKELAPISNLVYADVENIDVEEKAINQIMRFALAKIYNDVLSNTITYHRLEDKEYSYGIYKDLIDSFKKRQDHGSEETRAWLNTMNDDDMYGLIHNIVINSFTSTGVEMMASMNAQTAIVSPVISGMVSGQEYGARPLFINAVGYTIEKGKKIPIFDIYMVDISRMKRGEDNPISQGAIENAIYTATMLSAKGYKVNQIHMLNYTKENVKGEGRGILIKYEGDNVITKRNLIGIDIFNDIVGRVKPDMEVLVPEDTLLRIGIKDTLTEEERVAGYMNKATKKVSYIASKMLKKDNSENIALYYSFDGKNYITQSEFNNDYIPTYTKAKDRKNKSAVVPNSIYTPIRAIPDSIQGSIDNNRKGFYGNKFFKDAKKAIMSLKSGDAVTREYIEEADFWFYNPNTKQVEKATYKNVVVFKVGEQIVGIQERITYGDDRMSVPEIDNLITEYVKTGDNNILTEIKNNLLSIEEDIATEIGADNPYVQANVDYNIEKIKMMRTEQSVMVKEVTGGTVILGESKSVKELFKHLNIKDAEWTYEYLGENKSFSLKATIKVDGKSVDVYTDARSIDDDYLISLSEKVDEAQERFNELYGKQELKNKDNTRALRELLEGEVADFIYANREKIREFIPDLFDKNGFVRYKPKKGSNTTGQESYSNVIANVKLAIELARQSLSGDLNQVYRKAIFMSGVKTKKTNDNIYLNNISTKVIDVAIPVANITIGGIDNTTTKEEKIAITTTLNNQITSEQKQQQKSDIAIGKIPNTNYEVKADGVSFEGKKLDNPNNLSYRQLIAEDIKRRGQEELKSTTDKVNNKLAKLEEKRDNKTATIDELDGIRQVKYYRDNYLQENLAKINAKYNAELESLNKIPEVLPKTVSPSGAGEVISEADYTTVEETVTPKKKRKKKDESIFNDINDVFGQEYGIDNNVPTEADNSNSINYDKNRKYVETQLKSNGTITIAGQTMTAEEFNNMNREEQDNLINCL